VLAHEQIRKASPPVGWDFLTGPLYLSTSLSDLIRLRQVAAKLVRRLHMVSEQKFATFGANQVPISLSAQDAELNGENPTLLYGYGGVRKFGQSVLIPPRRGKLCGLKCGVYVLAYWGGGRYWVKLHQARA